MCHSRTPEFQLLKIMNKKMKAITKQINTKKLKIYPIFNKFTGISVMWCRKDNQILFHFLTSISKNVTNIQFFLTIVNICIPKLRSIKL